LWAINKAMAMSSSASVAPFCPAMPPDELIFQSITKLPSVSGTYWSVYFHNPSNKVLSAMTAAISMPYPMPSETVS
jgi:hypothetical protein